MFLIILLTILYQTTSKITLKESTYFETQLKALEEKVCPFVGFQSSSDCPNKPSGSSKPGSFYSELVTYDIVTRSVRYPIIDLKESEVKLTNFSPMKRITQTASFTNTEEFFKSYVSFNSSKPFANGIFHTTLEMMQFFYSYFGNQMNSFLGVTHDSYVSFNKKLVQPSFIPTRIIHFKKEVQDIIDNYLPDNYSELHYKKFVETFGTQLSVECDYGGISELQVFLKKCLNLQTPQNLILQGMRNDLDRNLDGSKEDRKGDPNYIHKSKVKSTNVMGGNVLLEDLRKRIQTFPLNPIVTQCKFIDIWKVIPGVKGQNLKKYHSLYIAAAAKKRTQDLANLKAKKKAYDLAQPIPINLVSATNFEYFPISLMANQTSKAYTFHYGGASHSFSCHCNSEKLCRCQGSGLGGKLPFVASGIQYIGQLAYKWEHCKHYIIGKHCKHYQIISDHYTYLNCEIVYKDTSGKIICGCNNF